MAKLHLHSSSSRFWVSSVRGSQLFKHSYDGNYSESWAPSKFLPQSGRAVMNAGKFVVGKRCQTCGGKGAIECPGCKGTGKNKKNGNIFERWKCFDCQGFGLKGCPSCGKGGLTPEQRGER